jgi:prolyl oligopeptidase
MHPRADAVTDPWRALEDAADPRTERWSQGQDEAFAAARGGWAGRAALKAEIAALYEIGWEDVPCWRGERAFAMRRDKGREHPVLTVTEPSGERRTLIDPAALDPTGLTTLDVWQPSQDGRRLAYGLSHGGREWAEIRVLDVTSGEVVDGPIDRTRHPSIAWLDAETFLYERFEPGDELVQRVRLHRIGSDPAADQVIFGAGLPHATYLDVVASRDGRRVAVTAQRGTDARNDLWVADAATLSFEPVTAGEDTSTWPVFDTKGELYVITNRDAPRRRVCRVDDGRWIELISEGAVIEDVALLADAGLIVVARSRHAVGEVAVHDLATGAHLRDLPLPGLGSITSLSVRDHGSEVWLGWTDFTTPSCVLRADAATAAVSSADPVTTVQIRQVVYPSYDGTPIHMFLIEPPGPAKPRPAILYGYGGFNSAMTPAWSPVIQAWVARGGVYAIAGLRGGSEEGEAWHRDGMREHKTNVFDDFAAASDWLVASGLTTRDRLGIRGRSNGGLLVGAALTRHPEKYRAVVCAAPLLDMLRFHLSGLGELWTGEYGSPDVPSEAEWLAAYSPYHQVTDGVAYPATLFVVFEGDTRVDPAHARKMCARLQDATAGPGPILIRRETGVGHSTRAVSRDVELAADELAFLLSELGG